VLISKKTINHAFSPRLAARHKARPFQTKDHAIMIIIKKTKLLINAQGNAKLLAKKYDIIDFG
jgi:hypothetical protein